MSAKKHRWVRPPLTRFRLACADCGLPWEPHQFEPRSACAPRKGTAVATPSAPSDGAA